MMVPAEVDMEVDVLGEEAGSWGFRGVAEGGFLV